MQFLHFHPFPAFRIPGGIAFSCVLASSVLAAETVDLRSGVTTTFHGGGFGNGGSAGDFYGWAIAFGDVDGDGYTDFLSSSANSEGPNDEHVAPEKDVYLFFGRPRSEVDSTYALDQPGVADIIFYKGGYSLACADIDADGYDDMILADAQATGGPSESGVYIIFGAPRDQLRTVYNFKPSRPDYTPPDLQVVGSGTLGGGKIDILNFDYDFVSRSLVTGDLNDDDFADIVIGDYSACPIPNVCLDGAVYVILGKPRNQLPATIDVRPSMAAPHPDIVISGDVDERYPVTLAIGDLDGDGIDDLLTSTTRGWGELNMVPGVGEIHCWWGRHNWKSLYRSELDEFDFALTGRSNDPVGFRMVTGDFDGDGRDDLVVGSPFTNRGDYRMYFGRSRALWSKWTDAMDKTDVLIHGASPGEILSTVGPFEWGICFSLSSGNRDGDRYDDLLIGTGRLRREDDLTRPGGAYWLRGRNRNGWEPLIDLSDDYSLRFYGAETVGSAGYDFDRVGFITGMADLDGNGLDEIFLAAPMADGPANSVPDCGEIYVIYDDEHVVTDAPSRPPLARASILPNYPNPFSSETTLRVQTPVGEEIDLALYDASGREVARPLATTVSPGTLELRWRPQDATGRALPSGVYFLKLRAGRETHSRKLVIVH